MPIKLRDDAIIETVCQVVFSASKDLPEIVLGRLSDFGSAGEFVATRLPVADIPSVVRRTDPNLKHQPLVELRGSGGRLVRVGENVISFHTVGSGNYGGWTQYRPELHRVLEQLYNKLSQVEVQNLTLRYINALVPERHLVKSVHELQLTVVVGENKFLGSMNLNFIEEGGSSHLVTTRIADVPFVQGNLPEGTVAILDVEVSIAKDRRISAIDDVHQWFDDAHQLEKKAFFKLIPPSVLSQLV